MALIALLVALGFWGALPGRAWAAVTCVDVTTETGLDADSDGFTDFQECSGVWLADGTTFVPSCGPSPADRTACLDPNTKDLFIIYAPAGSGSLLGTLPNPFATNLTAYGITFNGLATLGVTVHLLSATQAAADRTVMSTALNTSVSTQKAVRVAESLDTNGTILGNCQWGTPNGLDGCVVYTQRIMNFINSTCAGLVIVTPAGVASTAQDAFLAYAIHVSIHETGHSIRGTANYNSSYGGNHYAAADQPGTGGKGTRMEQYVTYGTKGGKCKFNVPADWSSLDPPAVQLR